MSFSPLQIFMYADNTCFFGTVYVLEHVDCCWRGTCQGGIHNNALESTEMIISDTQRLLNHHRGLFLPLESICCLAPAQFGTINL